MPPARKPTAPPELPQVSLGRTGRSVSRVGLGAMPLSIQGRPADRDAAKRVVRRAVELGVTFIDTADVYCVNERDRGHNERLIREALDETGVPKGRVLVATKGGIRRPGGAWVRDAKPARLRQACEDSLRALGIPRIDLYQLHAPDPAVPLEDSVGELARLRDEGKIAAVGLSNVDPAELDLAQRIVETASVQNRFSPWDRSSEENGMLARCHADGITFIPYSPLGGSRRVQLLRGSAALRAIAERRGATPEEAVLAWVLSRSPSLVPIPGARRVASIESSVRALELRLDPAELTELEAIFETLPG